MTTTQSAPPRVTLRPSRTRRARAIAAVISPVLQAFVVTACVTIITFFLIRVLLGDPAERLAMSNGVAGSPERVAALRVELGLDQPLLIQFFDYVVGLLHGDLGQSFQYRGTDVSSIVVNGFGTTLALAGLTLVISAVVGIALGLLTASINSPLFDNVVRILAMVGLSAPGALVGLVLILTVALGSGMLPAGGWGSSYPDNFQYLILPALTLSVWLTPILLRVVRERAGEILLEPFAEAAVARGMSNPRLLLAHVARNTAVPVLTMLGLSIGNLLSGAVIVEVVFGLPGIGRALTNAVTGNDFPVIQAVVLLSGTVVVLSNMAAEIAGRAIDPRTRR